MAKALPRNFERTTTPDGGIQWSFEALKYPSFLAGGLMKPALTVLVVVVGVICIALALTTGGHDGNWWWFLVFCVFVLALRFFCLSKKNEVFQLTGDSLFKFGNYEIPPEDFNDMGVNRVTINTYQAYSILHCNVRGSNICIAVGKNEVIRGVYQDIISLANK